MAVQGAFLSTSDNELAPGSPSSSVKRKNKRFVEDLMKGNFERIKEKIKTMDTNFWVDEDGSG